MVLLSMDGDNEDDGRRNSIMRPREKQIAEELFRREKMDKEFIPIFVYFPNRVSACTPYTFDPPRNNECILCNTNALQDEGQYQWSLLDVLPPAIHSVSSGMQKATLGYQRWSDSTSPPSRRAPA